MSSVWIFSSWGFPSQS